MLVATLTATTGAWATAAPVSSRTSPVRVAVSCWAWSATGESTKAASGSDSQSFFDMVILLARGDRDREAEGTRTNCGSVGRGRYAPRRPLSTRDHSSRRPLVSGIQIHVS